jgi:CDP-glucose 4,6-dehydratase
MESMVTEGNLKKVFNGKRVFITGHTGFKGSWLLLWLHLLGADTKGYSLSPKTPEDFYNKICNKIPHQSVIADILDRKKLADEIHSFQPDYIFHLAAQPLVRKSYNIPSETFEINVVGTANILEATVSLKKKCVAVAVTTDKVYENAETNIAFKETDRLGGYDPYSASKACAEIVASSFSQSYFQNKKSNIYQKRIATARAGNVIGGGDWNEDRIIPDIIHHLKKGLPVPVRNPLSVRPWQHVLEPLSGYLLLAGALYDDDNEKISDAYNFGPEENDHLQVKELVALAIKNWGKGSWEDQADAAAVHEAGILKLDISRAKNELQWFPKLSSAEAIRFTIDWYKQPEDAVFNFSVSQIRQYQQL